MLMKWLRGEKELFELNRKSLAMSEAVFVMDDRERVDAADQCIKAVSGSYAALNGRLGARAFGLMALPAAVGLAQSFAAAARPQQAAGLALAACAMGLGSAISGLSSLRVNFFRNALRNAYLGTTAAAYMNDRAAFAETDIGREINAMVPPAVVEAKFAAVMKRRDSIEADYGRAQAETKAYFALRPKNG